VNWQGNMKMQIETGVLMAYVYSFCLPFPLKINPIDHNPKT
jgi:hypothetical protein